MRVLSKVEEIGFVRLTDKDVVRHPLVQKIVRAYEEYEKKHQKRRDNGALYNNRNDTGRDKRTNVSDN